MQWRLRRAFTSEFCVVPSVAEDRRVGRVFQKQLRHGHFVDLALGEGERDRPARGIDDRVDLRAESATGGADGFGAPPFTPEAS